MIGTESEDGDLTDVKRRLPSKSEPNMSRYSCPNQAGCQQHSKTNNLNHSHGTIVADNAQGMLKAR